MQFTPLTFDPLLFALIATFVASAAVLDFRTQKIPNYLTVTGAIVGLVYQSFAGAGILWSLAGLGIGFVLLLLPFILGGGGAGDVKLLAALGAWLGPMWIAVTFGLAAILGTFISLSMLTIAACQVGIGATKRQYNLAGAGVADGRPRKLKRHLPFVVPIAISTWLVLGYFVMKSMGHQ